MTKTRATILGFGAVLMWALLALLTVKTVPIPPFQLTAMSFAIGGSLGLVWVLVTGEAKSLKSISWKIYAFGTVGYLAIISYIFPPCVLHQLPKLD